MANSIEVFYEDLCQKILEDECDNSFYTFHYTSKNKNDLYYSFKEYNNYSELINEFNKRYPMYRIKAIKDVCCMDFCDYNQDPTKCSMYFTVFYMKNFNKGESKNIKQQ